MVLDLRRYVQLRRLSPGLVEAAELPNAHTVVVQETAGLIDLLVAPLRDVDVRTVVTS